jgi:16S rRNA (adenine1518-N6/adenine1519-N6)-dimethyltransferase
VTHTPTQLRALLADNGLSLSRALGQNFVADPNTVRKIAGLANVGPGDHVVEVGAGLGSLTLALAETGASVLAIEIDKHVTPVLRTVVEPHGVTVVQADAMDTDWPQLLSGSVDWTLVANLPYNIGTPLVADLMDFVPQIKRMVVLVQAEVADRFAASPRTPAYGALSVKTAYWATARVIMRVSPNVFVPPPKVDSALVEIVRRDQPAVDASRELLFALIKAGFGQRRKMLRRSLAPLLGDAAEASLIAAEIAPTARAEELDVHDWGRLATWISNQGDTLLTQN